MTRAERIRLLAELSLETSLTTKTVELWLRGRASAGTAYALKAAADNLGVTVACACLREGYEAKERGVRH